LNVSPLTLRRRTLAGKVKSKKLGRKHMFSKADLYAMGTVFTKEASSSLLSELEYTLPWRPSKA